MQDEDKNRDQLIDELNEMRRRVAELETTQATAMDTQETMRVNEERFRGMFEKHSAVMLLIEPVTGRIMDANKAAVLFYGYTVSHLCSMSIQEINALPPDDADAQRKLAIEEHRSHLMFPHRLANGEVRTVEVHSSPIEQNGAILLFSIIHDITERKQADQRILDITTYAENIVNTVREPLVVLDWDIRVVSANQSFYRMFGVTPEESTGNLLYDLGNRQWDIPRLHELLEEVLPEKTVVTDFEVDHVFPAIGQKFMSLNARQVVSEEGEERRKLILLAIEDITERKHTEQRILNILAYVENIVNTVREPLVVLDGEMHVVSANDSFYRMFDVTSEETQGNSLYDLGNRQWDIPRLHELLEEILPDKAEVRDFEVDHFFPAIGHKILFLNARQVIRGWREEGRKLILLAIEDVTDRKRLEAERLEIQRKLLQVQKLESLGVMAGGIAHDFNNLLQVVLGNLELVLTDLPPDSKVRKSILNAIKAADRSAELSGQMLTYSGSSLYLPKDIHLDELLNKSRNLLNLGVPENVTLTIDVSKTVPHIKGNADQIQRVITNLLTNSSESIGDSGGAITIRTGVMDCDEMYLSRSRPVEHPRPGRFAFIEVEDTGCGMDTETLYKLFDPFFTTRFWGRGLGMAEVIGAVKGHHGAIIVDSEVGRGTSVRVLFPASEKIQESSVQAKDVVETKLSQSDNVPRRKTILVVDDEEMVRGLVSRRLDALGYDMIEASDGDEGVRVFQSRSNEIDLVLLDFAMPRMNGVEAFGKLIKIKPDVKVILSSGYTEDVVLQNFPSQRPAGVLHKPYKMEDMKGELEKLLGTTDRGVIRM
jgi:PAS domain S-box-containing protein